MLHWMESYFNSVHFFLECQKNLDAIPTQLSFKMSGEMQYMLKKNACDKFTCTTAEITLMFGASGWLIDNNHLLFFTSCM